MNHRSSVQRWGSRNHSESTPTRISITQTTPVMKGKAVMEKRQMSDRYGVFAAMIATATVVMFGLMYLNTYERSHLFFSETRAYMAVLMGATMAMVMLPFMFRMYTRKLVNIGIFIGSAAVFALALWLVRSQRTVDDVSWMKAMIPHHSIAILTSEHAQISDPRVQKLADQIIESQRREIEEMKELLRELAGKRNNQETAAKSLLTRNDQKRKQQEDRKE